MQPRLRINFQGEVRFVFMVKLLELLDLALLSLCPGLKCVNEA